MPLTQFLVSGKVYASDGITPFPDVTVYLRNKTKNEEHTFTTNSLGEFIFNLADFNFGYNTSDSLELRAELGSFYKKETATLSGESWEQDLTLGSNPDFRRMNFNLFKEEIIVFLRNNITDPQSRGTVKTDSFIGDGSTVKYELTEPNAKNVFYVSVGGTVLTRNTDYYVDYKDKTTLNNPIVYILSPPSSSAIVDIKYSYGSTWVYSDFPRLSLKINDYPRIKVDILSVRTEEFGLNADFNISDMLVELIVWSGNVNELDSIIKETRDKFLGNKKKFHFFKLIIPSTVGPMIPTPERGDKIVQRNCDYFIKFKPEEV